MNWWAGKVVDSAKSQSKLNIHKSKFFLRVVRVLCGEWVFRPHLLSGKSGKFWPAAQVFISGIRFVSIQVTDNKLAPLVTSLS
jgi:hypothetical protein